MEGALRSQKILMHSSIFSGRTLIVTTRASMATSHRQYIGRMRSFGIRRKPARRGRESARHGHLRFDEVDYPRSRPLFAPLT